METGFRLTAVEKKQLNEIFVANSLRQTDFDTVTNAPSFQLKCKTDYFSFVVARNQRPNSFLLRYNKVDTPKLRDLNKTWQETLTIFGNWCKEVYAELNTSTGWEDFNSFSFFPGDPVGEHTSPFKDEEKKVIREGLVYIGSEIEEVKEFSAEQFKIINDKLTQLSIQVDRSSKYDWKSFCRGTFENMIASGIIPADLAPRVMQFVFTAFGSLGKLPDTI